MKKIVLTIAVVFGMIAVSNAQFKQAAGDKSFELQFAPLGGSPVGINGIQFKSYSSETTALRLNIFVGRTNESKITQQPCDTFTTTGSVEQLELREKNATTEIGLRPGIEKHFAGTDRLSPYVGAELDVAKKWSAKKEESQYNGKTGDDPKVFVKKTSGKDGYLRLGVNLVAGFDYFFTKKLFIGAEFGFGVSSTFKSKIKVTDKGAEQIASDNNTTYVKILDEKQGGTFNLGPNVNTQIRVGFLF
jgi:hypothetical protein